MNLKLLKLLFGSSALGSYYTVASSLAPPTYFYPNRYIEKSRGSFISLEGRDSTLLVARASIRIVGRIKRPHFVGKT